MLLHYMGVALMSLSVYAYRYIDLVELDSMTDKSCMHSMRTNIKQVFLSPITHHHLDPQIQHSVVHPQLYL